MQPGDPITFRYHGKEFAGLLIQEKDDHFTVKLSTGYNMIVPIEELTDLAPATIGKTHAPAHAKPPHAHAMRDILPKVVILHTGGTIASKVDYASGAVVAQFDPEELIAMFPELAHVADIESRLLANMQSDDMRLAHYNIMARAIIEEIGKGAAGIIITHGTDTMHYTAAALAFAIEGLNLPVVLVGSQRSSDRGSSDAAENLMGALRFIAQPQSERTPGVFIAMHASSDDGTIAIIDGLHARKNHTSRRDAFTSIGAPLIARVMGDRVEYIDTGRAQALRAAAEKKPRVLPYDEGLKIGLWKAHPQSYADELLVYDHYHGLVIEGTGLGHAPITAIDAHTAEHDRIRERILHLAKKLPVVMASQTIWGRVNMQVYSPGRTLLEGGVIGQGCDTTPECAFIKLAWLLSQHDGHKGHAMIRELFEKDLRGEAGSRSPLIDTHQG